MEGTAAAVRLLVMALLLPAGASAADTDPRLPVVATASLPRSERFSIVDGIAYYSHYSEDGNSKDILRIDPESGATTRLVESVPDARFVAADDRYVVYSPAGNVARPLVLRDRRSGATSTSIRLRQAVIAARLQQNRLVVMQQDEALFFSLPDLQLVGKKPMPWAGGGQYAAVQIEHQGNRFVAQGKRQLFILDEDLNVLSAWPIAATSGLDTGCDFAGLKLANSVALLIPGCGRIRVYQLDTGKELYELDVGGTYPQFEIIGDVIIVADPSTEPQRRMRLFDLHTGNSLGRVEGVADGMAARGGRLLVFERGVAYRDPTRIVVYAPDLAAIRDEKARLARLVSGCNGPAQDLARDPYAVVRACEAAGITDYLAGAEPPRAVRPALERYATGLAQTTSRFEQALPVLDRLGPPAQFDALRALVARKQAILGQVSPGPRSEPERAGVRKHAFPYSYSIEPPVFIGSHLFLYGWNCDAGSEVRLQVHDRKTLQPLQDLRIVPCDNEYEDAIGSVQEAAGYILVGLDYKYDEPRPNLAVVDPQDFSLVGVLAVPGAIDDLYVCGNKVLSFPGGNQVQELDLKSAQLVQPAKQVLAACSDPTARQPVVGESAEEPRSRADTPGFRLQRSSSNSLATIARVENKAVPGNSYDLTRRSDASFIGVPGRDAVVVLEYENGFRRMSLVDLAARESRTLLELGSAADWGIPVVWRNYLLQSHGRDLLLYDLDRSVVIGYDANLIGEGVRPLCDGCEDGNRIANLVLDGDRLLALTLKGENSRVIELPAYVQTFGSTDLFTRSR